MEEAITAATERDSTLNFTHVGIFSQNNAADSVLEATQRRRRTDRSAGEFSEPGGPYRRSAGCRCNALRDRGFLW